MSLNDYVAKIKFVDNFIALRQQREKERKRVTKY
jgi:hypothetical protein